VLVPAPDEKARLEIFKIYTKSVPLDKAVSVNALAKATEGFTGADIEALVLEAGLNALREDMKAKSVTKKHLDAALKAAVPSVNAEVRKAYEAMAGEMKRPVEKKAPAPSYVG
ncbi:MAG TPA: AAA family ATPase, partial [archaeon]|nr:AAA family ATPase [archaeon]